MTRNAAVLLGIALWLGGACTGGGGDPTADAGDDQNVDASGASTLDAGRDVNASTDANTGADANTSADANASTDANTSADANTSTDAAVDASAEDSSVASDAGADSGASGACPTIAELVGTSSSFEVTRIYESSLLRGPLVLDGTWLYVGEDTGTGEGSEGIRRISLDGQTTQLVREHEAIHTFDAEGNVLVYATAKGIGQAREGRMWTAPVDEPATAATLLMDDKQEPVQIATDGSHLYWHSWIRYDGFAKKGLAGLGTPGELPIVDSADHWELQGANLYAATRDDSLIYRVPTSGAAPTLLLDVGALHENNDVTSITLDGDTVYYRVWRSQLASDVRYSLWSFTIGDSEPTLIQDAQAGLFHVRARGGIAYWYTRSADGCYALNVSSASGHDKRVLVSRLADAYGYVVAAADGLYILFSDAVYRVSEP